MQTSIAEYGSSVVKASRVLALLFHTHTADAFSFHLGDDDDVKHHMTHAVWDEPTR